MITVGLLWDYCTCRACRRNCLPDSVVVMVVNV